MNKVEKIKAEIERRKNQFVSQAEAFHKIGKEDKESYYASLASNMNSLSCFIDSIKEDPVSNDLEEAATKHARKQLSNPDYPTYNDEYEMECAFEAGAQWQKERDQSTIELAEDHAYLAGQEKIIEKACEWLNNFYSEDRHCYFVEEDIDNFKKAMEE